ncbi:MAG: YihY/virulence factor BrkB family protein [Pseudomonadota bacterium]
MSRGAPARMSAALVVAVSAVRNYIAHQSANQAGSVAFSFLIAMFPLLVLASSLAAFFGRPGDAAALAGRVLAYAPELARQSLQPSVDQLLGHRSQALVALGLIATVWTASSGIQAIRTALNKAYGIEHGLPFWKARIKVTVFTLVAGIGAVAAFGSVLVMPHVWRFLQHDADVDVRAGWVQDAVRYGAAFVVLSGVYAALYRWLPDDLSHRPRHVLPGALIGAALWIGAAALLSVTLRSATKLVLIYGGFTGAVATLVFLYASASTLILGAELNAVWRPRRAPA